MLKLTRKPFVAAALALAVCAAGSRSVAWAKDTMAIDHVKVATDHMDKMKMMAADPAHSQQMTADQAKMMVMDHMAMQMAMDPKCKQMVMQSMSDANVKKVHDDAKKMAEDTTQMSKLQQAIMADPMAMQMVMHMAEKMSMMPDGMMKDDKMKDAKMKDMPSDKK